MRFLVTGSAGFIGFHLCRRLIALGHTVDGLDGMTDYYDPALKRARHVVLANSNQFRAHETMLEDMDSLSRIVNEAQPDIVVHLAAQAGVRYSMEEPRSYVSANVVGTFNLLEALRAAPVSHLMLASTSSVYGANAMPFCEGDRTDHPLSFYAATKKATEAMAHSYAHLYAIPTTVMRFFTVYGPWGRPDMALFKFTRSILAGEPIDIYNAGQMQRDFTFVDDAIEGVVRLAELIPAASDGAAGSPAAPYRVVNIAGGKPVNLEDYISAIEVATGRRAIRNELPMQMGEPQSTLASTQELERLTGFRPRTPVDEGVRAFVDWYRAFYRV
ncbi:MAG: UDP-glucuronate 5-epimerase [Hyphomicrobiales bacterium]|nr:UDP-glucuronate 5-epimerase [Hyphomicrobiales bacterium]